MMDHSHMTSALTRREGWLVEMHTIVLGPKLSFAKRDKHYPNRFGLTSLATAGTNITKPVTKNNFGPSTFQVDWSDGGVHKSKNFADVIFECPIRESCERTGSGGGRGGEIFRTTSSFYPSHHASLKLISPVDELPFKATTVQTQCPV